MGGPARVEGWVSDPVEATFPPDGTIPPTANQDAITFRTVTIPLAGDAVQGPDVEIPNGRSVMVIVRTGQSTRKGFVANSSANVGDPTMRGEIPVDGIRLYFISNMNLLWFGADTDGTVIELQVEQ